MYAVVLRVSRWMAYAGGLTLSLLVVMTCVSIAGRTSSTLLNSDFMQASFPDVATWLLALGVGPIKGDFELVEAGMAFTIFAFLPICQITSGHALVDVFTSRMSQQSNRVLACISDGLFSIVLCVITIQLFQGMQSKMASGQTTFLIEFPIWWAYALSLSGAIVATGAAIYVALVRTLEMTTGRALLPADTEGRP